MYKITKNDNLKDNVLAPKLKEPLKIFALLQIAVLPLQIGQKGKKPPLTYSYTWASLNAFCLTDKGDIPSRTSKSFDRNIDFLKKESYTTA